MTGFEVDPDELDAAAHAARAAAEAAGGASGLDLVPSAAAAIPGSDSGPLLARWASQWQADVAAWSTGATAFADSLATHATTARQIDDTAAIVGTALRGRVAGVP